jgi:hypothetical protein
VAKLPPGFKITFAGKKVKSCGQKWIKLRGEFGIGWAISKHLRRTKGFHPFYGGEC